MRTTALVFALVAASPAAAATKNAFSSEFYKLSNTDFIVSISFLVFIGVLFYFKVPGRIGDMLDNRASSIQSDLDEARALREEAQTLLASYERKQREVQEQADRIVAQAKESATESAAQAKADLEKSIERRLQTAQDQITSAESAAVKRVRDEAARIAVAAAGEVAAKQMSDAKANALVEDAISTVRAKLH